MLVTTGQPATNPRLVKEANALCDAGYRVSVCYAYWAAWASEFDNEILKKVKWQAILCGGAPTSEKTKWYWTRLRHRVSRYLTQFPVFLYRAMCRSYDELLGEAIHLKGDIYLAHNLGALPIVAKAGKALQKPYGFDAEDFHREETIDKNGRINKTKVEDTFIPGSSYLSAASPLIALEYAKLYPKQKIITLNNIFPKSEQFDFLPLDHEFPLRLIWFSQTIGLKRGLQNVLRSFDSLQDVSIELTLIGQSSQKVINELTKLNLHDLHKITFIDPVSQETLLQYAAKHHIGIASETGFSKNNEIALSNKLFTYLLAGNAIAASNTVAQSLFMHEYPEVGFVYEADQSELLAKQLRYWHENRDKLEATRLASWTIANQELNWENESKKFVSLIGGILNNH